MKILRKCALVACLASAGVLALTVPAQAASGTAKAPYKSGAKVIAAANLNGPNPVGTQLCVYLNAQHPFTPDVNVASKCKKINAGTVSVSVTPNQCSNWTTWAVAKYNGRIIWQGSSKYNFICP